jgi:hypothetical protein
MAKNIKLVETCSYCEFKKYKEVGQLDNVFLPKKIIIDPKKWDGSDIFSITGLERMVLITDKVKKLIIDNGLRGSIITKAENFEETVY